MASIASRNAVAETEPVESVGMIENREANQCREPVENILSIRSGYERGDSLAPQMGLAPKNGLGEKSQRLSLDRPSQSSNFSYSPELRFSTRSAQVDEIAFR